jgi:hypothetical protein
MKSLSVTQGVYRTLTGEVRRSVTILAVLGVAGYLAYVLTETIPILQRGLPTTPLQKLNIIGNFGGVFISLALLFTALRRRVWVPHLIRLALILEVIVCFLISLETSWRVQLISGRPPAFSWVTIIILLFPLIVPSTPLRTFIASLASAATVPMALIVLQLAGVIRFRPFHFLGAMIPPSIAVAGAVLGSIRTVGLRRRFGNFQLAEKIGDGGRGEVWKAKHRFVTKYAAIKFIRRDVLGSVRGRSREEILDEFFREANIASQLSSPQAITLFDVGITEAGTLYFVMEYLDGLNLEDLVDKHGPLPPGRVRQILYETCQPLEEAHGKEWTDGKGQQRKGVIHRDVKPSNVFLYIGGVVFDSVKLLDWGIAFTGGPPGIRGTPGYMSPEQINGNPLDARSDVYGLGCFAYWLLTGCYVFEGDPDGMVAWHRGPGKPVPPSQRVREQPHRAGPVTWEIPACLDEVVLKCLEKDPARRPQSINEVRDILENCELDEWNYGDAQAWWQEKEPRIAGRGRGK